MGFIIALILIAIAWYLLDRYLMSYWKRNGFKQLEPTFLLGHSKRLLAQTASFYEVFDEFYYKSKGEKFIGMYNLYKPSLLVTDPHMIHDIFIKDFAYFHDHSIEFDTEHDPLAGFLFSLTGQKWRDLRVKLSPTFTAGKLRWMFPVMKQSSEVLVDFIQKGLDKNEPVFGFGELFRRYNANLISSVAFGIDNDCINNPNNDFYIYGLKNFENSFRNAIRQFLFTFMPSLMSVFKVKFAPNDVDEFFMKIVREIVEYREKNNFSRNDFMDLLIQLKNQGYVSADKDDLDLDDEKEHIETENIGTDQKTLKKLTFNELAAQAFVFYLAAFETNSAAMTFCLIELARNPELQKKAQNEVDEVFQAFDVTYDAVKNLKYLEACMLEALRKYPPAPIHSRECTKDYKIPNTNLVIQKGTDIKVPIMSLHRDPEIYENPHEFIPERFLDSPTGNSKLDDQKSAIFYSPFGDGPRHCIGMRMARASFKLIIAVLLSNFTFYLDDDRLYHEDVKFDTKSFPLRPDHDVRLKAVARKH
ncbi:probable cytochrome P450 6d5 [Chironomus tepperi]|uniref:probable cytochrome P450 6d5 n=1 Tax=Chironomus tepperi TaxID=113505 RepID=UPI00391EF24C